MKTKAIILLGLVALITLSFSFASTKKDTAGNTASTVAVHEQSIPSEPIGGFAAEDLVK